MKDYLACLSDAARRMEGSAIRKMGARAAAVPGMISFAPGYPDPHTFAWSDLRDIADDLLSERDNWTLQYGPTRGFGWMLDALVEILAARRIQATTNQVMVTTGSQQGLDLVARLLIDPGDVVLVELPTYTGAIAAAGVGGETCFLPFTRAGRTRQDSTFRLPSATPRSRVDRRIHDRPTLR